MSDRISEASLAQGVINSQTENVSWQQRVFGGHMQHSGQLELHTLSSTLLHFNLAHPFFKSIILA